MGEKSNIELLKEFAYYTKREIFYKEEQYPLSSYRQIPRFKTTVYIPNNKEGTSYFVLYSDPYCKIGEHTSFCGVYIPIKVPLTTKINFRKKDILDKLNPFNNGKLLNTGNSFFDSKVVTKGNNIQLTQSLLTETGFQNKIIESFKLNELNMFSINETDVDFVEDLKGKSHFCIYNPQKWILDNSIIEKWFEIIEEIRIFFRVKTL